MVEGEYKSSQAKPVVLKSRTIKPLHMPMQRDQDWCPVLKEITTGYGCVVELGEFNLSLLRMWGSEKILLLLRKTSYS